MLCSRALYKFVASRLNSVCITYCLHCDGAQDKAQDKSSLIKNGPTFMVGSNLQGSNSELDATVVSSKVNLRTISKSSIEHCFYSWHFLGLACTPNSE